MAPVAARHAARAVAAMVFFFMMDFLSFLVAFVGGFLKFPFLPPIEMQKRPGILFPAVF
jgi:hypothetical protein